MKRDQTNERPRHQPSADDARPCCITDWVHISYLISLAPLIFYFLHWLPSPTTFRFTIADVYSHTLYPLNNIPVLPIWWHQAEPQLPSRLPCNFPNQRLQFLYFIPFLIFSPPFHVSSSPQMFFIMKKISRYYFNFYTQFLCSSTTAIRKF